MSSSRNFQKSVGVCTHFESREIGWKIEKLLPLLLELGAGHVRQEIKWEWVEKEKGKYEIPEVSLQWVEAVAKAGLGIILILDYGNPLYENPLDPDGFAGYAEFMAEFLKEYPIIAFEIWNEPTNFYFLEQYGGSWSGKTESLWLDKFCELVNQAATAIRRVNPAAKIITNPGEPQYFHMTRKHPHAFREIDGISHHPYPVRLPPETLPLGGGEICADDGVACADDSHSFISLFEYSIVHGLKTLRKRLEMYATEFGFSTYNANARPGWGAGYNEITQACFLTRAVILCLVAGVNSPCIYDLMNDGIDPNEGEQNFGLLRNELQNYAPKPAFHAVKRLLAALGEDWEFLPEPPVTIDVPSGNFDQGLIWQRRVKEPFVKIDYPLIYCFRKTKSCLFFVWKAGRVNAEGHPPTGRVIWENAPQVREVVIEDLVTGESLPELLGEPPKCGQYSERFILKGIPFRASPIAIRLELE